MHEHESNGVIGDGNKLGKGILRVLLLALEARVSGRIPCSRPAFAWLTEHAGDILSKYLVGKDGKTAYERLYGKPVHEEALEFGEQLWWRPPRVAGYNVLMEPRWRPGVWLGRKWGTPTHIVFSAEDGQVRYVRAVQRRPATDRWALEALQAVTAVPPALRLPATAGVPEPIEILPLEASAVPPHQCVVSPTSTHCSSSMSSLLTSRLFGSASTSPNISWLRCLSCCISFLFASMISFVLALSFFAPPACPYVTYTTNCVFQLALRWYFAALPASWAS